MISAIGEFKETQDPSQTAIASKPDLRRMTSHPNLAMRKPEILSSKKRKASVPDVSIGPMTTVQEGLLDSREWIAIRNVCINRSDVVAATIPHHHPFLARSQTFPESVLGRLSEDISEKTPRISDFPKPNLGLSSSWSQTETRCDELGQTIVSATSKNGTVIPTKAEISIAVATQRSEAQDNMDEKPPKVPPKSPRTESRASPRMKQLQHSANSSTSTIHSTCSSATSANGPFGRSPRKTRQNSHDADIPQDQPEVSNTDEGKPPRNRPKRIEQLDRQTPPRVESPISPQSNFYKCEPKVEVGPWAGLDQIGRKSSPRNESSSFQDDESNAVGENSCGRSPKSTNADGSACTPYLQEQPVGKLNSVQRSNSGKRVWHQKEVSGASLIDRGRPMKRGDTSLMGTLGRQNLMNLKLTEDSLELPTGFVAQEASKFMPNRDLELLKQEAESEVESFEVLSAKDVSNLSKAS